jgi:hypothetical protein
MIPEGMVTCVTVPGVTVKAWFTPGKAEAIVPLVATVEEMNMEITAVGLWFGGKAIQKSVPTVVNVCVVPRKNIDRLKHSMNKNRLNS